MPLLLGLKPKHTDPRTLQFRTMRAPAPAVPAAYSWDSEHQGAVPTPMFANDRYGDCVIAARAHQTLRFEWQESGGILPQISDGEVVTEYLKESGGVDSGLVMLYAMRAWRGGWTAGGKVYKIHSFLEVQPQDHGLVTEALCVGLGLQFGVRLPLSASDQMNAHEPWDLVSGPRSEAGSWGGHAMLSVSYDESGVEFVTWGKRQRATWRWIDAYADECYLVIDDIDRTLETIDTERLTVALDNL